MSLQNFFSCHLTTLTFGRRFSRFFLIQPQQIHFIRVSPPLPALEGVTQGGPSSPSDATVLEFRRGFTLVQGGGQLSPLNLSLPPNLWLQQQYAVVKPANTSVF